MTADAPAIAPAPFRPAVPDDVSRLVALQATYYAEDGIRSTPLWRAASGARCWLTGYRRMLSAL